MEEEEDVKDAWYNKDMCLFVWPFLSLDDLRKVRMLTYDDNPEHLASKKWLCNTLMCLNPEEELKRLFGVGVEIRNAEDKKRRFLIAFHVCLQMSRKKTMEGIFTGTPMVDWTYCRGYDWLSEPWNPFCQIDQDAERNPEKVMPLAAMFFAWCLWTFKDPPYVSNRGVRSCSPVDPPVILDNNNVPKPFADGFRTRKFPLHVKNMIQAPHVYFATRAWLKRVAEEERVYTRTKYLKVKERKMRVIVMSDVFSQEFLESREMKESKLFNVMNYCDNWFLMNYVECMWREALDRNDILLEKSKGFIVLQKKRKDTSSVRFQ